MSSSGTAELALGELNKVQLQLPDDCVGCILASVEWELPDIFKLLNVNNYMPRMVYTYVARIKCQVVLGVQYYSRPRPKHQGVYYHKFDNFDGLVSLKGSIRVTANPTRSSREKAVAAIKKMKGIETPAKPARTFTHLELYPEAIGVPFTRAVNLTAQSYLRVDMYDSEFVANKTKLRIRIGHSTNNVETINYFINRFDLKYITELDCRMVPSESVKRLPNVIKLRTTKCVTVQQFPNITHLSIPIRILPLLESEFAALTSSAQLTTLDIRMSREGVLPLDLSIRVKTLNIHANTEISSGEFGKYNDLMEHMDVNLIITAKLLDSSYYDEHGQYQWLSVNEYWDYLRREIGYSYTQLERKLNVTVRMKCVREDIEDVKFVIGYTPNTIVTPNYPPELNEYIIGILND